MPIWKLIPALLTSDKWDVSNFRGELIMRAGSELEARMGASREFRKSHKVDRGEVITARADPWEDTNVVSSEQLNNSEYADKDGDPQVLFKGAAT